MKVIVGMSGGVDSAVSAYLLKKEGYEVEALFMRNWDSTINMEFDTDEDLNDICPQEKDYNDALAVCKQLDIKLHRVDFVKEYWDYVFTYFLEELKKGYTPNPDMLCNRFIKFDLFLKEAKKLGADKIATGHYANTRDGLLFRGVDTNKDQSYFLADVVKGQFDNVIFPVGNYTKDVIRDIAREADLPVKDKKDSTGICFIGERNYQKFISNYLYANPGKIIDISNMTEIGNHTGLMNYTIGQRKNIGLSGNLDRAYVCGKNLKENILYVAFGDNEYLISDKCTVNNLNFLSDRRPLDLTVKFRYRGEDIPVKMKYYDDYVEVNYVNSAKSVTPGQACVFYDGDECLGCGFINEVFKENNKLWYVNS